MASHKRSTLWWVRELRRSGRGTKALAQALTQAQARELWRVYGQIDNPRPDR